MKNSWLLLLAILSLGTSLAQESNTEVNYRNEIGLNLSDLINGSLQIRYERSLGDHWAASLGFGLKSEEGLIRFSGLRTSRLTTNDLTYSGFKIIPEVRYYIKKTRQFRMDGFYFGAYLKHTNYSSEINGVFIDDDGSPLDIRFDGRLKLTSWGLMVGYKWAINKRFAIDFLIAGPGTGYHNYSIRNTQDLPESFYDSLNETLSEYAIFDFLDSDFRFSTTEERARFRLLSFRYGITLSYAF